MNTDDAYSFGKMKTRENGLYTCSYQSEKHQVLMGKEVQSHLDGVIPEDPGNIFFENCFEEIRDTKYPDRSHIMIPSVFPRSVLQCCAGNFCTKQRDLLERREIFDYEGKHSGLPLSCVLCRNIVCSGKCLKTQGGMCLKCDHLHVCHNQDKCLASTSGGMYGWLLKKRIAPKHPITNKPLSYNIFEEHSFPCRVCEKLLCHLCVQTIQVCHQCITKGSKYNTDLFVMCHY